MTWQTYRCMTDTLAIQLADLTCDLFEALAGGQISDVSDSTDPRTPDEIVASVRAATQHLAGAAYELHNLAIQPRETSR